MYKKVSDDIFRDWVRNQKCRLAILEEEGFNEAQAMEMLKIWEISYLDAIYEK